MKTIIISIFIILYSGLLHAQPQAEFVPIEKNTKSINSEPVFFQVEEMPIFSYYDCSESMDCFNRYIADSLRIPSMNCSGKLYVQFIVEPDSTVDNVKFIMGLNNCPGYDKEIERLFAIMPKWIPGKQRGKAVRVSITTPIIFNPNQ